MYRAPTPPTLNPRNQVTIDLMILASDAAKNTGNIPHMHALGNSMKALRHTPVFVDTLEKASEVNWLTYFAFSSVSIKTGNAFIALPRACMCGIFPVFFAIVT